MIAVIAIAVQYEKMMKDELYKNRQVLRCFIIIYYSWNGGRAEAVCAGGKGVD
jgi:hypothetical protein